MCCWLHINAGEKGMTPSLPANLQCVKQRADWDFEPWLTACLGKWFLNSKTGDCTLLYFSICHGNSHTLMKRKFWEDLIAYILKGHSIKLFFFLKPSQYPLLCCHQKLVIKDLFSSIVNKYGFLSVQFYHDTTTWPV